MSRSSGSGAIWSSPTSAPASLGFSSPSPRKGTRCTPSIRASTRAVSAGNVDPTFHQLLAETYHAPVQLHPTTFQQADFAESSLDVVLSVSTIEHFGPDDLQSFAESVRRALKPGGHVVLTIDLFLDLIPFTDRAENRWGTNMSVAALMEALDATIVVGDPKVLYGFPDFDARRIQADLSAYMIGAYPTLTQCVVARVGS